MDFGGDNLRENHQNVRSYGTQDYTVRKAYEDGGLKAGASRLARIAYSVLSRRKAAEEGAARLARVLSALDLTALGVGSTLGVGVYVLAGDVAKNLAGPAVILSFLLAAVASVFAGLCYAEFGARVPKAGSAYVYSYVCVGEFIAFIIGWNLILEYIIGAASVVKALSEYLDALLNKAISTHLESVMPMESPHLARYPDVFAFTVIMAFSVGLAFGVKESTKFNNFCTGVNLCVVLFVIISGSFKADPKNWRIPAEEVPKSEHKDFGCGGFAPHGIAGIIKGAAVCFYGFIGFDCVATAGEEARRPQKSIPFAVVASLLVVFLAYFGVSCVLTLVLPYYMQDEKAPFPHIYDYLGWQWAKYAVSVGAICALCSSLLGAVFPLPRIIYAMSSDGLLFRFLGQVSEKYQTPLAGTIIAGLFTGTLAMIFRLEQLIHMMSIGTLLAYSMVASCVLLLRYEYGQAPHRAQEALRVSLGGAARQLLNAEGHAAPTRLSAATVAVLVTFYGNCTPTPTPTPNCIGPHPPQRRHRGRARHLLRAATVAVLVTFYGNCTPTPHSHTELHRSPPASAPPPWPCSSPSTVTTPLHPLPHRTASVPTRLSAATVAVLVTFYGNYTTTTPLYDSHRSPKQCFVNVDSGEGVWCFVMMSAVNQYGDAILAGHVGAVAMFSVGTVLVILTLYFISRQPVSDKKLAFSVPLVPWLPGLSILINIYLMLNLDYMTWARFGVWIAAGKWM
ncbi:unnamed protein product [Arctia plantaginis]|uniref:Cationic amino acid transporter C-terminal domain-containing protein n=1 Tax=Arctia plantaginis TaxID=874455 RepID=A0A8S1BPR7_ARCPL|nr:unnamed protein product [Arctia plantaginis]